MRWGRKNTDGPIEIERPAGEGEGLILHEQSWLSEPAAAAEHLSRRAARRKEQADWEEARAAELRAADAEDGPYTRQLQEYYRNPTFRTDERGERD